LMKNGMLEMYENTNKVIDYYTLNKDSSLGHLRKGSKKISFVNYDIQKPRIQLSEDLIISFGVKCNEKVEKLDFSFDIVNENFENIAHISNQDDEFYIVELLQEGLDFQINAQIKNVNLAPGVYYISLWAGDNYEWFDYIENCMKFSVDQGSNLILRPSAYDISSKVVLASKWGVSNL
jgi:hypothetical protein